MLQPLLEILDLSLLPGELPLEFVDAGLDWSVDSIGDLTGLAVKRLPRLLSVVRHLGDVAVSAADEQGGAIRCVIVDMGLPPSMLIGVNSPTIRTLSGMPATPGKPLLRRSKISMVSGIGKPAVKAYWAWTQQLASRFAAAFEACARKASLHLAHSPHQFWSELVETGNLGKTASSS